MKKTFADMEHRAITQKQNGDFSSCKAWKTNLAAIESKIMGADYMREIVSPLANLGVSKSSQAWKYFLYCIT